MLSGFTLGLATRLARSTARQLISASSVLSALTALSAFSLSAQTPDTILPFDHSSVMVPVRDGIRLHTDIYVPKGDHSALPFIMLRTPYGTGGAPRQLRSYLRDLADDGYIFVFQDIRGRYGSEGEFVMNRPPLHLSDPKAVDESTDTYDTVDWLLKNIPNNTGGVGVLGVSYPGWLAAMAGIDPHPAVKAISPQAPMTDTGLDDDFFHQGAFRLSYGFEYSSDLELSKDESVPLPITRFDTYDWYLEQGPLSSLTRLMASRVPTWTNFTRHPTYDAFWQERALPKYLTKLSVPTLTVGGWWDQEDFYGALKTYATLEQLDTQGINFLVMGPWNHGGWSRGPGNKLGAIDFADSTSIYFRQKVQAPWFAHWLKGKGDLALPEALLFTAGSNDWRSYDRWPPPKATQKRLYFQADGKLSFDAPTTHDSRLTTAYDRFISDPAHPVPYRQRPIQQTYDRRGSQWYTWLLEDQRQVAGRPDVLSWEMGPLSEDLTVAGDISATLFARTTGRDADWVVKLIDVYPDSMPGDWNMGGFQLMVASDIMRGRYRKSFSQPLPVPPNTVTQFTVDLHQQSYTFKRGHRIMVQVQSSWFPVYDRNPQTWVPNIFEAKASDFKAQEHRVYRSAGSASYVSVSVVPN